MKNGPSSSLILQSNAESRTFFGNGVDPWPESLFWKPKRVVSLITYIHYYTFLNCRMDPSLFQFKLPLTGQIDLSLSCCLLLVELTPPFQLSLTGQIDLSLSSFLLLNRSLPFKLSLMGQSDLSLLLCLLLVESISSFPAVSYWLNRSVPFKLFLTRQIDLSLSSCLLPVESICPF